MKKKGGIFISRAAVDNSTINKEEKTFEVVFATETPVLRSPYWADETFYEVLVCDKKSIRSERLDNGVVPLLDTHGNYSVTNQFGIVRSWSLKDGECRAVVQYSSQAGKADMWNDIETGIIRSISVGAKIYKYDRVPNNDPKKVPTYRAVDWEPMEVSLAAVPADYMSSVRGETGNEEYDIEISNYNLNRSVMTEQEIREQQEAALKAQRAKDKEIRDMVRAAKLDEEYADALVERNVTVEVARTEIAAKTAEPRALTEADVQRAATAERERGVEIRKAVKVARAQMPAVFTEEYADELIGRSVGGKVLTLDAVRAEILQKMSENEKNIGGPGGVHIGRDLSAEAKKEDIINGMMHRAMPGSVERFAAIDKDPQRKPFEVHRNEYKHMKLVDLCREMLIARGVTGVNTMAPNEIAKRAIDTTDMPDLFTSTVKRFLRLYYAPVVPEWMQFSRQVTADDFRVKTGVKVSAAVTFEELAEDGEYKESNLMSNEKATLQLRTYARSFGITRKTIVNDDLGVLSRLPQMIGTGARQFQSKKVWGMITGNVLCPDGNALFSAAHGNLGTAKNASVINDASLSNARTAMRRQKDPQGNELMVVPKYLLVPPELQTTAEKQIRPISATQVSNTNLWTDLQPFTNVYFADTQKWYMVADPAMMGGADGIVHAYLEGQEGLYTESYVDHKTDKVVIKARLDFDCAVWGWQGWYRNDGAAPVAD